MLLLVHSASRRAATLALALVVANAAAGCACEAEKKPEVSVYLDPSVVVAGRTTTLYLRGTNTRFEEDGLGEEDVDFGDEALRLRRIRVDGDLQARMELFVEPGAGAGERTVTIRTRERALETPLEVRRVAEEATLTINPARGAAGAVGMLLELRGRGTCFESGATTLRFFPEAGGVSVDSFDVRDSGGASARLSISSDAPTADLSAVVDEPCGVVSANFRVISDLGPRIRLEPDEAFPAERVEVRVVGDGTSFEQDVTEVEFEYLDVEVGEVLVLGPEELIVTLDVGDATAPGTAPLRTVTGPAVQEAGFSILPLPGAPFIRVLPNHVHQGEHTYLWVEGVRTAFGEGLSAALVGARAGLTLHGAWAVGPTDAVLELEAAADAPVRTVIVEVVAGDDVLRGPLSVLEAAEGTVTVAPAFLTAGDIDVPMTISGTGTAFQVGRTSVRFPAASGVSLDSVEVVGATEIQARVDVSTSAPYGPTELEILGGVEPLRARLEIDGVEPLRVVPPAVRAGVGAVMLSLDAEGAGAPRDDAEARVYTPELSAATPAAGGGDTVEVPVDVGAGARPGWSSIAYRSGDVARAAPLPVLPSSVPLVEPSRPTIVAGESTLVGLTAVDASFIDGVTSVRGPMVFGQRFFGDDLFVQLDVPSDTPPGPTGIVITTHGEVAACVVEVVPPPDPPSAVAEPASAARGWEGEVRVLGRGTSFEPGETIAGFPGALGVDVVGVHVQGAESLTLDVTVADDAAIGTLPLTIRTDLEVVGMPFGVMEVEGDPIVFVDPLRIRTGGAATIGAITRDMDLSGDVAVELDWDGIAVLGWRVISGSELEIELDATRDAAVGLAWISVIAGDQRASALLRVLGGIPHVDAEHERLTRGHGPVEVSWDVPFASLSPGDTLARTMPVGARLRVLRVAPSAPEQVNLTLEALPPGPNLPAKLLLVTGNEVVVGPLDLRAAGAAGLSHDGEAAGDAIPGAPALFLLDEGETWLDVGLSAGRAVVEILSADGRIVLDGPGDRARFLVVGDIPPFVRVGAADDVGGAFALGTDDLALGAVRELEPNAEPASAELLGDPAVASAFLCATTGGADVDLLRADATAPAALEILSGTVGAEWSAPRISLLPVDDEGIAIGPAEVGEDPIVAVTHGAPAYFALGARLGSYGPYLASLRPLVTVSEVAPHEDDDAFIELRAVPDAALGGWAVEILDADGGLLGTIDLAGLVVPADRLLVVGAADADEVDLVDAWVRSLPSSAGEIRVTWEGRTLDSVAYGRAEGGEGEPAEAPPEGGSLARPYGIDRDVNATDFAPLTVPTPGAPNR